MHRCQWPWATELSAYGRGRALSRSKVQGRAIPGRAEARGRVARPGVSQSPRRASRTYSCAPESSAYHGTWSAGGGCSHDAWDCSRSGFSPPIITPRTPVIPRLAASKCWTGQSKLLTRLTHTPRLVHPSQEGPHASPATQALWLCHNFRRICRQSKRGTFSFYFALGLQVQCLGLYPQLLPQSPGSGSVVAANFESTSGEASWPPGSERFG